MVEAFKQVHDSHPHTRLLMVGDGDERQILEQLVQKHNLADSVIFTGYQSDTANYMAVIDLYLLTSFSEGTSMTLLEAMANETCSKVTAVGGNVELIEHLANGVVVESGDTNALAHWMTKLADDPDHRHKLGEQARLTYEQKFSVDQMAAHYTATYDEVTRKK